MDRLTRFARVRRVALTLVLLATPCLVLGAQQAPSSPPMSAEQKAEMDAMMKAMAPGENHTLLASVAGDWTFTHTMWMDPAAPPATSTGTASYTTIMGGRYVQGTYRGMMMGMPFEGVGVTGYDNISKQFVSSWYDNFGTGIMMLTGTYDAATRTFTYSSDVDDPMKPGTKVKVREVIRLVDPTRHVMEWYETRAGKESKTMEIVYTRKK